LADAGSKPATSTKLRNSSDRSRPPQASKNAACSDLTTNHYLVPTGLDWSPARHESVTFSSQHSIDHLCDKLKPYGTRECHHFRKRIFEKHQSLASDLTDSYLSAVKEKSYVDANRNLLQVNDRLSIHDLNLSSDQATIKAFCLKRSHECTQLAEKSHYSDSAYQLACKIAIRYQITPPNPKDYQGDIIPCLKRLASERWWKKKIQRLQRKTIESIARDIGLVSQQKSAYASNFSKAVRRQQKIRNDEYLKNTFIENSEGQQFSLKELHDSSVANPTIRRAELMTRIKGFETVAQQLGHSGEFYTITTPSRMHARLKAGGANPKYDGTTPDEAQAYLNQLFCCIRAKLKRDGLDIYGIRVVEPNHDGTPHWHLLLFMEPSICDRVRDIFKTYALKEDGRERGAAKHRFTAKAIDPNKGSAAGYVAKYISKNIDGANLDKDLLGNDAKESAKAIDAWASTYNIRQFQFLGGPSVTVWRELRRAANSPEALPSDYPIAVHQALQAADSSEWAAYCMLMGGPNMRKSERPIQPLYDRKVFMDTATGEINPEALSAYGDTKMPKIIGLVIGTSKLITRLQNWAIVTGRNATEAASNVRGCSVAATPPLDLCQ